MYIIVVTWLTLAPDPDPNPDPHPHPNPNPHTLCLDTTNPNRKNAQQWQ